MRLVYDEKLAQAAYLIGCPASGEAIVIDPERDIDRYEAVARGAGLRVTAVAETHIHADFVSGAREFAERGAVVYASAEGGPDWASRWLESGGYRHRLVRDGDVFAIGSVEFRVLHTPGHTPEHVCYVVTDRGGGATEPMGVLTGDFVFVGDVGRPDLLESAAGQAGAAGPAARALFKSAGRFRSFPDYLQVWPAHGAGSACGKALGAVPQSTVGYEKRFNAALAGARDEAAFVDFVLAGQPEPPAYFGRMKQLNRDGPPVLGALPRPPRLSPEALRTLDTSAAALVDTRPWSRFMAGHVPGSLYLPLNASFSTDAGSLLAPDEDIHLVVSEPQLDEAVRGLVRVGLDRIRGWVEPETVESLPRNGGMLDTAPEVSVSEAREETAKGGLALDVRRAAEFESGHAPGAVNISHTRLREHLSELPRGQRIMVNCQAGGRSARVTAFLRRRGYDAVNVAGGFSAWCAAGLPMDEKG